MEVTHRALIAALEEAVSDSRLQFLCQKFGVEPWFVTEISEADPTDGRYVPWLVRAAAAGRLLKYGIAPVLTMKPRLGEIRDVLSSFARLSRKGGWKGEKDLMKYRDVDAVAAAVQENVGLESKGEVNRRLAKDGLNLLAERGDLTLFRIDTAQAADKHLRSAPVGPDGPWCVKDNAHWEKYSPPFYYIRQTVPGGWRHYKLLHLPDPSAPDAKGYECRNGDNVDTSPTEFAELGVQFDSLWEIAAQGNSKSHPIFGMLRQNPVLRPQAIKYWSDHGNAITLTAFTQTLASELYDIALDDPDAPEARPDAFEMLGPEAMATVARNGTAVAALYRWGFVPKRRWPEAEPAILEQTDRIGDYWYGANPSPAPRWPEGEAALLANAENASALTNYASVILKGAWPEAEPTMLEIAVTDAVPPDPYDNELRYSKSHHMREVADYSAKYKGGDWPEFRDAVAAAPWPEEEKRKWLAKAGLA